MSTRDENATRESLADIEHVQAAFDKQQKQLDEMQHALQERRAPFDQEAVRLRKNLTDDVAVQHGNTIDEKNIGKIRVDNRNQDATTRKQEKKVSVTQSQYQKIVRRIQSPKPALAPKPPKGIVPRNVDHDLKQLAKIRAKLDEASNKLQNDFKQAQSHKRK